MKTLVFDDPFLAHPIGARIVHAFIGGAIATNRDVISSLIWGPEYEGISMRSLIIQCPHRYSAMLLDGINEALIQGRLAIVSDYLLEKLAWKFSSPALTSAFRDYILVTSPGDKTLPG
jgi:hypothetical protein